MSTTSTMDLPKEVPSYEELIKYQTVTQGSFYVVTATLALLVYEYLITLDMEIEYMWSRRFGLTTVLFFINRYFALIRGVLHLYYALHPPSTARSCTRVTDVLSWTAMIGVLLVEILMLLRAWALWNRRLLVAIILIAVWVSAAGAGVAVVKSDLQALPHAIPLPPRSVLWCDRPSPFKYIAEYCIGLIVEVTSLVFMLGRVFWLGIGVKQQLPILKALKIQGAYYFLAVISMMSFTILSGYVENLARPIMFTGITPSITSIACTRVIFALRGLFLHPETDHCLPPSYTSGSLPPYDHGSHGDGDKFGSPRRRNPRNLALRLAAPGGHSTAQSTDPGVYQLTTFEDITYGGVTSTAGITASPASPPETRTTPRTNHDRQYWPETSEGFSPQIASFSGRSIQGRLEEGRQENERTS